MNHRQKIPNYDLEEFRYLHRGLSDPSDFGYSNLSADKKIEGFEMYSTQGVVEQLNPVRSKFFRLGFTVSGSVEVKIGLETFKHQSGTINLTHPNQIFSLGKRTSDFFGYYLLFDSNFMNEVIPYLSLFEDFPYFSISGTPFFKLNTPELNQTLSLFKAIDTELKDGRQFLKKNIQLYVYLILNEAKRSYLRQDLLNQSRLTTSDRIISTFLKLVGKHIPDKRNVADYAEMMSISANHLNRIIKDGTARTASDYIKEMLLLDASEQLQYTTKTIAQISDRLGFSEPSAFSRFFKQAKKVTPKNYRGNL